MTLEERKRTIRPQYLDVVNSNSNKCKYIVEYVQIKIIYMDFLFVVVTHYCIHYTQYVKAKQQQQNFRIISEWL